LPSIVSHVTGGIDLAFYLGFARGSVQRIFLISSISMDNIKLCHELWVECVCASGAGVSTQSRNVWIDLMLHCIDPWHF